MLLVAKRRRVALHVALLPLAAALVIGGAAAHGLTNEASRGPVSMAVLAGGMLVYVIATLRTVRARGHTLRVRALGSTTTFDARAAAFGVSASYGGRSGASYTVYVTDGMRRSDIVAYGSRRALKAAERLTDVFAVANPGGSCEARGLVAREIAKWKAQEDESMRQVNAYYASPAWKRMPIYIGVGLALYVAVTTAVMLLHK